MTCFPMNLSIKQPVRPQSMMSQCTPISITSFIVVVDIRKNVQSSPQHESNVVTKNVKTPTGSVANFTFEAQEPLKPWGTGLQQPNSGKTIEITLTVIGSLNRGTHIFARGTGVKRNPIQQFSHVLCWQHFSQALMLTQ